MCAPQKDFGKLKNSDFTKIISGGKKIRGRYMTLFYLHDADLKVGIALSKKINKAVLRNRAKRRFREIIRKNRQCVEVYGEQVWLLEPEFLNTHIKNIEKDFFNVLNKTV